MVVIGRFRGQGDMLNSKDLNLNFEAEFIEPEKSLSLFQIDCGDYIGHSILETSGGNRTAKYEIHGDRLVKLTDYASGGFSNMYFTGFIQAIHPVTKNGDMNFYNEINNKKAKLFNHDETLRTSFCYDDNIVALYDPMNRLKTVLIMKIV